MSHTVTTMRQLPEPCIHRALAVLLQCELLSHNRHLLAGISTDHWHHAKLRLSGGSHIILQWPGRMFTAPQVLI
jgi:hypothetical protein